MHYTTLYRVEGSTDDLLKNLSSEPLCELVRAGSPREAAEIAGRFWARELGTVTPVDRLTVQRLHEPLGGTGLIYEAALHEDRFVSDQERVVPLKEGPRSLLERMLLTVST